MRRSNPHFSFWFLLAATLAGALLTHPLIAGSLFPAAVWVESLRPLLIALTLCALAAAATLVYGGPPEPSTEWTPPAPASHLERPALLMVATLTLVFLVLPLR